MVALELSINGQRACLAGASGVVWSTMFWGRFVNADGESKLRVGGREYGQPKGGAFYRWAEHGLKIGDEVTVRLIESDAVDAKALYPPSHDVPRCAGSNANGVARSKPRVAVCGAP
jgi:hypothetical protein